VGSLAFLGLGAYLMLHLRTTFFPLDLQYWSYVDVWLPNDAPLAATNKVAIQAEDVIRAVAEEYDRTHPDTHGRPRQLLKSLTTFVGGGGPRFWFSVAPELQQLNYAQLIIEITDKEEMPRFVDHLQQALSRAVPGALLDVRQLQTNPVDIPLEVRLFGRSDLDLRPEDDMRTLRRLAEQVKDIFRAIPAITRVRDDWGDESFLVQLHIDPDRANLAGVTNLDVAMSSVSGISGLQVATLREENKQIPVVTRLRMEERAQLADLQNLYVYAAQSAQKVPLLEVAVLQSTLETQRIRRLEHFRTITVKGFPASGALPSEGLRPAWPQLMAFAKTLPPGYSMQIGGEYAKQQQGFANLMIVLAISVAAIYLALVFQFKSAIKPLLVFAAVPYGTVGALAALYIMGTPFGFMAFLGIASLVGIIVSHVIVLFDFIEERHEAGEPLIESLLDAGIARLRPVLITVGATVLALLPLALHGGPLWEPLCYAQIGGLSVATFIELLLVPVLYAVFVLDLKLVTWETTVERSYVGSTEAEE
jgi:multidrug efflux pump subunit AcrB